MRICQMLRVRLSTVASEAKIAFLRYQLTVAARQKPISPSSAAPGAPAASTAAPQHRSASRLCFWPIRREISPRASDSAVLLASHIHGGPPPHPSAHLHGSLTASRPSPTLHPLSALLPRPHSRVLPTETSRCSPAPTIHVSPRSATAPHPVLHPAPEADVSVSRRALPGRATRRAGQCETPGRSNPAHSNT